MFVLATPRGALHSGIIPGSGGPHDGTQAGCSRQASYPLSYSFIPQGFAQRLEPDLNPGGGSCCPVQGPPTAEARVGPEHPSPAEAGEKEGVGRPLEYKRFKGELLRTGRVGSQVPLPLKYHLVLLGAIPSVDGSFQSAGSNPNKTKSDPKQKKRMCLTVHLGENSLRKCKGGQSNNFAFYWLLTDKFGDLGPAFLTCLCLFQHFLICEMD